MNRRQLLTSLVAAPIAAAVGKQNPTGIAMPETVMGFVKWRVLRRHGSEWKWHTQYHRPIVARIERLDGKEWE